MTAIRCWTRSTRTCGYPYDTLHQQETNEVRTLDYPSPALQEASHVDGRAAGFDRAD